MIVLFSVFPIIWTFLISLKPEEDIVTRTLTYIPTRITFENYVAIWTRSNFPTLIVNSAVVTLITVSICVVVGTLASYAVARYRFRGRREMMMLYLVVRMFPAVMIIIPLFILMRGVGLLDSRFGLALAYTTFLLPVFIWMMKGFFEAVPNDLEDAARIDGASRIGAMVRVVLPLVVGGLVATAVFVAIGAWNEFLFALMLDDQHGFADMARGAATDGRRVPTALGLAGGRRHHLHRAGDGTLCGDAARNGPRPYGRRGEKLTGSPAPRRAG